MSDSAAPTAVARPWVLLLLGWVMLSLVYTVGLVGNWGARLQSAVMWAFATITVAVLLGGGIWFLTGKVAWPARVRPSFIVFHLLAASVYSVAFVSIDVAVSAVIRDRPYIELWKSVILGIDWVLGVFLYGIIVGVCYAIRMNRRYREQLAAAALAEGVAAKAQVGALRAQLNPHFLFNALHSLAPLVRHNPAAAEDALDKLGDLLRYALDDNMSGDVTLGDEWAFVRNYLALEKLRLGDRLDIDARLDAGALDELVPSFLLQPLVENAVRHGIAPRRSGGRLSISARREGDRLLVSVQDDGDGADARDVETASGLGYRALRQRLAVRYGGRATMTLETARGRGFGVRLDLPTLDERAGATPLPGRIATAGA